MGRSPRGLGNETVLPPVALTVEALLELPGQLDRVVDVAAGVGIDIVGGTALRWCMTGSHDIVLPSIKVGGVRMTKPAMFVRWLAAVEAKRSSASRPAPGLDQAAAEKVLAAHGLARGRKGGE